MTKLKCMVFISGNGSNLKNILSNIESGFIKDVTIEYVVSDNKNANGIKYAKEHGIKVLYIDNNYKLISGLIKEMGIGLVILAGYMKIIPKDFMRMHDGIIINIHPSLLPKYKGLDTHKKVLDNGDNQHGASVHFATEELDSGPVIIQGVVKVNNNDDISSLRGKVHEVEYKILPLAIKWFSENIVSKHGDNYYYQGEKRTSPIILL